MAFFFNTNSTAKNGNYPPGTQKNRYGLNEPFLKL